MPWALMLQTLATLEACFGIVMTGDESIRIINRGMDSVQVIARFEAEFQALALMDHPNIAKVLDNGGGLKRIHFGSENGSTSVVAQ